VLFILFQIGADRYALEASRVVEVIPLLELRPVPNAPRGVAGLFNYRGNTIPAVDLPKMITGRAAAERLTTRILIVRTDPGRGTDGLLGLIAERATTTLRKDPQDFVHTGIGHSTASHLGPVLLDEHGVVQWIQEQRLIPENLRQSLLPAAPAVANGSD
jgi:chemotaxis-related protein WspB